MDRTLVVARSIFTGREVISPGALVVAGSTIEAIGAPDELAQRGPFASAVGNAEAFDVLPGLVNGHHHSLRPNRPGLVDGPLELNLLQLRRRRLPPLTEEEEHDHTLWGALALLRTGVTTVIDCYSPNFALHQYGLPVGLDAYLESGMRVALCVRCSDRVNFSYETDRVFLDRISSDLARQSREKSRPFDAQKFFAICESVAREYDGRDGRVRVGYGPTGDQWCSDELLRTIAQTAAARGAPVQMHLLESPYQVAAASINYGASALGRLRQAGMLGPTTSFAHGVWLAREEIGTIRDADGTIVNNPASNLTMGNGIAPVAEMISAGCRVGLGMDANGFESTFDMFREMRLAHLLQQVPGWASPNLSASDVLTMATAHGAYAAAMPATIGVLAEGAAADFIMIDRDRLVATPYSGQQQLPELLIGSGSPDAISTVFVGGRVVMERTEQSDARFKALETRVRQSVERYLPLLEDADAEFRELRHHLEEYLAGIDLTKWGIRAGDRNRRPEPS